MAFQITWHVQITKRPSKLAYVKIFKHQKYNNRFESEKHVYIYNIHFKTASP